MQKRFSVDLKLKTLAQTASVIVTLLLCQVAIQQVCHVLHIRLRIDKMQARRKGAFNRVDIAVRKFYASHFLIKKSYLSILITSFIFHKVAFLSSKCKVVNTII